MKTQSLVCFLIIGREERVRGEKDIGFNTCLREDANTERTNPARTNDNPGRRIEHEMAVNRKSTDQRIPSVLLL